MTGPGRIRRGTPPHPEPSTPAERRLEAAVERFRAPEREDALTPPLVRPPSVDATPRGASGALTAPGAGIRRLDARITEETFEIDARAFFAHLDPEASGLATLLTPEGRRTVGIDFEASLLNHVDEALAVLQRPEGEVSPSLRQAAAHYLFYTAAFMTIGNDALAAGEITLDDLTSRVRFGRSMALPPRPLAPRADGRRRIPRAEQAEIVARREFITELLRLVATVDGGDLAQIFLDLSQARLELRSGVGLSESTTAELHREISRGSMTTLVSVLAGLHPNDTPEFLLDGIYARFRQISLFSSRPDAARREGVAPLAAEVSMVLLADGLVRRTVDAMPERGDSSGLSRWAQNIRIMFDSLGVAIDMYEDALARTADLDPPWSARVLVQERLRLARALRSEVFSEEPSEDVMRDVMEHWSAQEVIDVQRCASCHTRRVDPSAFRPFLDTDH